MSYMTTTDTIKFDQRYMFAGPACFEGETSHAWCEMFIASDQSHVTAPTPYTEVSQAVAAFERRGWLVDELVDDDIADAMTYVPA
jgi:hypothetical protein